MLLRQKRLLFDYLGGSQSQTQEMQLQFAAKTITQVTFTNKPAQQSRARRRGVEGSPILSSEIVYFTEQSTAGIS